MSGVSGILELARWAPSGDNTQPWRFEIVSPSRLVVHGFDTRDRCVYDLDGWASQLAHGALLETIALAATRYSRVVHTDAADERDPRHLKYPITLRQDASVVEHPLVSVIQERAVQRRGMSTTPLTAQQRRVLSECVSGYELGLFSSARDRMRLARLAAMNAKIRLTIREAYEVHRAVIAWNSSTSDDRMPDASLGADPLTLAVMRRAMVSWERVHFLNRYAAGTLAPRLSLDLLPGVRCSAHFALIAPKEPLNIVDRVNAGRAVQQLWLTATKLGLQMQPSYTPLVFARYFREGRRFTTSADAYPTAAKVNARLNQLLGQERAVRTVFLGRIGPARNVVGRSLRLPMEQLMYQPISE